MEASSGLTEKFLNTIQDNLLTQIVDETKCIVLRIRKCFEFIYYLNGIPLIIFIQHNSACTLVSMSVGFK
jgi:hypothetical protein